MTTTLEITPEYFVCGDFDSRKRYLRADAAGPIAICDGITWEIQTNVVIIAIQSNQPWVPWRFSIPSFLTINASTQTYSGRSASAVVPDPSSVVTRVNF